MLPLVHTSQVPSASPAVFSFGCKVGPVCLISAGKGCWYAFADQCPPFGLPLSSSAVVDTVVGVVEDEYFGTRFNLANGSLRGKVCSGGSAGFAASLLAKIACIFVRRAALRSFPVHVGEDGWIRIELTNNELQGRNTGKECE